MNKERRIKIEKIIININAVKSTLQNVLDDEQFAFDNMQNFQGGMRGMESENAIENMENAIEKLEEAIEELTNI